MLAGGNTPMAFNQILEKLKKLIAHEQSAREIGSMAEAEAFAAKIQDLLTTHKLDMSEVDFQAREEGEPINWESVDSKYGQKNTGLKAHWRLILARSIAKVNSCEIVNNSRSHGRSFYFVGRTSDRELAKVLYLYLVELGEEICAKASREDREVQSLKFNVQRGISDYSVPTWAKAAFASHMKSYRESWKEGFGEAVSKRIEERYEETLRAQAQTSANAIIHIKKDALAVKDFLKGKIRQGRARSQKDDSNADGYNRGKQTGNAVNLSPNRFNGTTGRTARLLGA
jgi:hypothetical protein